LWAREPFNPRGEFKRSVFWNHMSCVLESCALCSGIMCPVFWNHVSCVLESCVLCSGIIMCPVFWNHVSCVLVNSYCKSKGCSAVDTANNIPQSVNTHLILSHST